MELSSVTDCIHVFLMETEILLKQRLVSLGFSMQPTNQNMISQQG